jgi:hypothetical protein
MRLFQSTLFLANDVDSEDDRASGSVLSALLMESLIDDHDEFVRNLAPTVNAL